MNAKEKQLKENLDAVWHCNSLLISLDILREMNAPQKDIDSILKKYTVAQDRCFKTFREAYINP